MILPWLVVLIPGATGIALLCAGRRGNRVAGWIAVAASGVVAALAVAAAAAARGRTEIAFLPQAPLRLRVDGLAAATTATVAVISVLVLLVALPEIGAGAWRFHALMLVFVAAVQLTVFADTLPALLAGWEAMGATSWALIAFQHRKPAARAGGLTAFLTTRTADLGLYLAAGAALAGTLGAAPAGGRLSIDGLSGLPTPWLHLAAAGVLVAGLGKAAQLPFSFWLSGAMEGPSPVSALLHSAAMVAMGGYLLLRTHPLLAAADWAAPTAAWVGALTALLLGAVALAQRDLKQLLAASTAAQLGYVVLAAGITAGPGAVSPGLAQLIAHAATKALLFLAAGIWLHALGTKQLDRLRGAARLWPVLGAAFVIGAASLAGLAPFSLWAAKDGVLAAAREQSLPLYVVGLGGAVLAAAYAGRALGLTLRPLPAQPERSWDDEQQGSRTVSWLERAPLLVLAAAAALLGVLELPPIAGPLAAALGQPHRITASPAELGTSAGLAVIAATLAARFATRVPAPAWAATWLHLSLVADRLVVRPVLGLSRAVARADDAGLDRLVAASATGVRSLARTAAKADDVGLDGLVRAVARGAQRAAGWAIRPQTGLVHQYYAQAAVLLAGLVALLALVR